MLKTLTKSKWFYHEKVRVILNRVSMRKNCSSLATRKCFEKIMENETIVEYYFVHTKHFHWHEIRQWIKFSSIKKSAYKLSQKVKEIIKIVKFYLKKKKCLKVLS